MNKTIKHEWMVITYKNKHKQCVRCKCEKKFDFEFGKTIFYDRFGKLHLSTPDCVLPNTKLT